MTKTAAPHPLNCARRIRWQRLADAGDPAEPPVWLVHRIAVAIAACCGHSRLKAHRLAFGWTIAVAVDRARAASSGTGAATLALSERSWKEWEAGKWPIDAYRDVLARLFQTGHVQLGYAADYTPVVDDTALVTLATEPAGETELRRRTMLLGGVGFALSVPLALPPLAAGGELEADRSGRVSPDTADDLRTIAASYRRSYRCLPSSRLLPAAHGHMEMALALNPAIQPEPVRASLLTVVGEMAALAGVLLMFDQRRYGDAAQYIDLVMKAGRAADSPELQAIALAGRAFHASYGTADIASARRGLDFAELAWEIGGTGASQLTRSWVAAVASERHAGVGDEAGCRRRLDDARTALELVPSDDTYWSGVGAFDAGKLLAYEGGDMVRLGRYADAEPVLDAALDGLAPAMRRHRCTALIDRAEARLGADDVDAACEDALLALQLAAEVQHAESLSRIDRFARRARESGAKSANSLWREVVLTRATTSSTPTLERP